MTTATVPVVEVDPRVRMLNAFMECPHRDTDKIMEVHRDLQTKDPEFYGHLAAWYMKNGELRDHQEVFAACLITDKGYIENREVGLALWQRHVDFMKARILGFVKGKIIKIRTKTGKKMKTDKGKEIPEVKVTEKKVGLNLQPPASFKTEIKRYLTWLEADPKRFDSVAFRNYGDLKELYFYTQGRHGLRLGDRAHDILFEKKYPEDSKLNLFEKISKASTPEEQAKLIVENKVPYTTAVGLISKITPTTLIALIDAMSPQELINNVASLQEKGAYDNPEVKALIEKKLEKAATSKKVSTLKSKTATGTGRIKDETIIKKLDAVADTQVKKSGTIKIPTLVLVDKSGSMSSAIETGKRVAALVSGATEAPLHVVAFDSMSREVSAEGTTLTAWEKAFRSISANGGTSIGSALDYCLRKNISFEQVIVITDEDENAAPYFVEVWDRYCAQMRVTPHVVVINVTDTSAGAPLRGLHRGFSTALTQKKIAFDVYKPANADYYGLPGLLPLLSRKSRLDLVYEIMDTPLPKRKGYDAVKS